ncbi:MAG: phosphatase PAP2 family protein [Gemmatimonadota bacterium]
MELAPHRWLRAAGLLGLLCLASPRSPLVAQLLTSSDTVPAKLLQVDGFHLGARGGLALAALVVMPFDEEVREVFRGSAQGQPMLGATASTFGQLGGAVVPLLGGGLWVAGKALGQETLTDVTGQALEGIMAAAAVTYLAKTLVGRERPTDREGGQWSYNLGRGFSDSHFRAFPSGHTAQAFALATVLSREMEDHGVAAVHYVRPLLFGAATVTGLSRIYHDRHWASDVLLGAMVGNMAGRLTQGHHTFGLPGTPILERSEDGGLAVGMQLRLP